MNQGIKAKDIRDFEKAVEKLQRVMSRINEYKPEAMAFLDNGDTFQLISDADAYDHYSDFGHSIEAGELVVTSVPVFGFGSGALG